MKLTTWSGSHVPFTWRILPRWALGWIRYVAVDRGPRPYLELCDCSGPWCVAHAAGIPTLGCRRRRRRLLVSRAIGVALVIAGLAALMALAMRGRQ